MADDFDPYYEWLGIPPKDHPPHHYRLLGIELFEQNPNVIERAADRQMGHVRSFQTGPHGKESQRLLNELSTAKVCLLNAQRKAEYDDQLQIKVAARSLLEFGMQLEEGGPLPEAIPVQLPSANSEPSPVASIELAKRPYAEKLLVTRRRKRFTLGTIVATTVIALLAGGFAFLQWSGNEGNPPLTSSQNAEQESTSSPDSAAPPTSSAAISSPTTPESSSTANESPQPDPVTTPDPVVVPATPQPPPVPEIIIVNEEAIPVEDPLTLVSSPAIPAKLERRITAAEGIRDDRFAFCQTLRLKQFDEIHRALRTEGYRLSRFRPYLTQSEWRVAAIWLRDGLPSRVIGLVDSQTLMEADQRLRQKGFTPVDCVGVASGPLELFGAVWVKPKSPVGETSITLGMPAGAIKDFKTQMQAGGFRPVVHSLYFDPTNSRKYCNLWIKATEDLEHFSWTGDSTFASRQLARDAIQADVSIALNQANNGVLFSGSQILGRKDTLTYFVGQAPSALKEKGAEQAAKGSIPCSLSIGSTSGGELVGVAVWRPANRPQTPLELASLITTSGSASTPATTVESRSGALRFTGQGSVELRGSTGLANISRDFTMEVWLRFNDEAYGTANILFGTGAYRGLHPEVTMAMKGWLVGIKPARTDGTDKSQFIMQWAESSGKIQTHTRDIMPFDGEWHHLAVCNHASTAGWEMVAYIDGQESVRFSYADAKDDPSPVGLYLGRPQWVAATRRALNGLMRACRLSSNVRYQANFKPDVQFAVDDQTLAMLDFSGASADVLPDLSGHQRHGQKKGVDWVDSNGNPLQSTTSLAGTTTPDMPPTEKLSPPATSESEVTKIREIFKSEYATAKEPQAMVALAEKLLTQAIQEQDSTIQIALLSEARRLAIEGADWNVAARVIGETVARFQLDPWLMRAETFTALTKKTKVATDRKILADIAVAQAEAAVADSAFDAADSILTSASSLAPRNERELVKQISDLRKRVMDEKKAQQAVTEARATLSQTPDHGAANETLGKYLCFTKEDWELGIPHLAKGPEGKLTTVARQDQARPADGVSRMALADSWWDLAKSSADAVTKGGATTRALYWYQLALPDLAGVKKLQTEKQIEDLSKAAGGSRGKVKFAWLEGQPGVAMELRGHSSDVTCAAVARSGRFLVSGSDDDTVRIWDLATGKQAGQITPGVREVNSLLLSADDRSVAIPVRSQGNYSIGIWSIQNGQPIGSVSADGYSRHIAGSQDWRRVVYAKLQSGQGNLLVYNLTTLAPVAPLNCPNSPVNIAVSRSGRYLAAADDNHIVYVWDLQTGKSSLPLTGHSESVTCLAFSPNERQLVSCAFRTVIIWDVVKGAEERRISPPKGIASAATFTPDGARLLISGMPTEIAIFSVKDGSQITSLDTRDRNGSNTRGIVCFPDGRAAASFGYENVIRVWRLPQ